MLAAATPATAAPGSPAAGFGSGGVVNVGAQLLGVAVQPNGEVVVAGQSGGRVFAERFTTGGAPDGSYTGPAGIARAVIVAADGDIVLAGTSGGAMLVQRLTPSLTVRWSASAAGGGGAANALASAPDGSIVAAGAIGNAPSTAAAAKFSAGGATLWAQTYGLGGNSTFAGVAVEPDGTIVAAGRRNPGQAVDAVIATLSPSGGLSAATTLDYPGSGVTAFSSVALLNTGQIVVAGQTTSDNVPAALFARYDVHLNLDGAFGSSGVTVLPASRSLNINPGGPVGANGVGITGPQGQIVGGGSFDVGAAEGDAALWSLAPGGSPDGGFGSGGVQLGPGPATGASGNEEVCGLAIAPNGSPNAGQIIAVGDTPGTPNQTPCASFESLVGFVASYAGYGPPPPPPAHGSAPTVSTSGAGSVTATSATVAGTVTPNGSATTYRFEYGTTTAYGASTPATTVGGSSASTAVSATLTGLIPNQTYHYRLVASNASGTSTGADRSFTTLAGTGPAATTGSSSGTTEVATRVHGTVRGNGTPVSYYFEYGSGSAYGHRTRAGTTDRTTTVNVSAVLRGLQAGTRYHYRLVATDGSGAGYGADRTVTTLPRLRVVLHSLQGQVRLRSLIRSGLTVAIACSAGCSISATLEISARTAGRLHLSRHGLVIAAGSAGRAGRGTVKLTLHLRRGMSRTIARLHGVPVTLRTVSRPQGGGPQVIGSQPVTLGP